MNKLKLTAKDIRYINYPDGPVISIAMNVMNKHYKHESKEKAIGVLKNILLQPDSFLLDEVLNIIAKQLLPKTNINEEEITLNTESIPFNIFGHEQIEEIALHQMHQATKLPISIAGALMPDAHSGYGLPIGGVLATENAVIPYGVGVDIGCRMCLSVYDANPNDLVSKNEFFKNTLQRETLFGSGAVFIKPYEHEVMDSNLFNEIGILKNLQHRAWKQLGSSGAGNHFVEFGEVKITEYDQVLNIPKGNYIGVLSHSGSRGLGASIAQHYTKLAISKRRLPQQAKNLAWLGLDEQEGFEYWLAMNLAGDYASACHNVIHKKIAKQLGQKPIRVVENHHNFAWKEIYNSKEVIVHRKGATPAGKNVLGIIPGSMTANGYIVKGKGEEASINSASHGAGRKMSRSKAMQSITHAQLKDELKKHNVQLIGGGLDEAPFAYKNIDEVMKGQKALVEIVGSFTPKIVRMDG